MGGADARGGRAERAAYRAFVRANHPDLGGDRDAFVAGIARWRGAHAATALRGTQPASRQRPPDRYDGPIVFVDDGHGAGRLTAAVRRWRERRSRPPRVR